MGNSKWRKGGSRKWARRNVKSRPQIANRTTVMSNVCGSGKRRYPSKPRAELAITKINGRNSDVMLTGCYPCRGGKDFASCDGWHTTSMKRRRISREEEPVRHNFLDL